MSSKTIYQPRYAKSWALVIGINEYQIASPLGYARQDAEGLAEVLTTRHGFPPEDVTVLLDGDATKEKILSAFHRFQKEDVSPDDRIAVFFAGHGLTRTGNRGEVGFLLPVDGDPDDPATLVRWDDLTRNADLITAKHMLFVMDACYGGLAVHRSIPAGSSRFLKNMLQRYSRQVLTAGKADETVADSGGPRPNHSIFTGHLLDALEGNAADAQGILSANAVMAYVYERVAKDPHSQQSPHYGFFDGDGDFIFSIPPSVPSGEQAEKEGSDLLVQMPAINLSPEDIANEPNLDDTVKEYLYDPRFRIRLDDLAAHEIRAVAQAFQEPEFSMTAAVTPDAFTARLRQYESAVARLSVVAMLVAKWGATEHQPILERIISRLADGNEMTGGKVVWLGLRWYPILLLIYGGGIAAMSGQNYTSLATLLNTRLGDHVSGRGTQEVIAATVTGILEVDRNEMFKRLPGYERNYVPRSEYLFKTIQPAIEDLLFLGRSYEELFDRFEIFYAITYADIEDKKGHHFWGPPGRFGWKISRGEHGNPYAALLEEATTAGAAWPPLRSGFFGGSVERFKEVVERYNTELLSRLGWF
ncbi:MAG: caspase family protein [Terracidiphilus sp.]